MTTTLPDFAELLPDFIGLAEERAKQLKRADVSATAAERSTEAALSLLRSADPATVNRTQAAKLLGVSRQTLHRWLS